jgi:hypothetical protein
MFADLVKAAHVSLSFTILNARGAGGMRGFDEPLISDR